MNFFIHSHNYDPSFLALAVIFDLEIHQMDYVMAIIDGDLIEIIFVNPPEEYVIDGHEYLVCLLVKWSYGLNKLNMHGIKTWIHPLLDF